jgi:Spy/CpxP family protein refolding chaperone
MKKIFLMCCLVVGFAAASHAQGGRMRMSPDEQAKAMQTQLKLTDDQTAKITSILTAQSTKMDSVRTASNGDRQAMMTGMQPIRQATQAKIATVLTPEQAAAYKKMQDDMRARMQNGGGGAPPSQK